MEIEKLKIKKFWFFTLGMKNIGKENLQKRYYHNRHADKNAEKYIAWIMKILKNEKTIKDGYEYSSLAIYANSYVIEKLHNYLYPMAWLNYSPTTCDELKNNEIGIDLETVLVKKI